jgi:lysophospholipase L1-like esterase
MQFGFNDLRHDGTRGKMPLSTLEEFEGHLTEMVRLCREKAGAKVIMFGNHKARRLEILPTGLQYDVARVAYNQVTKRVAAKMGVPYRDMSETFADVGEHYSDFVCEDGVHLSPFGLNAYGSVAAMDIMRIMQSE